MKNLLLTCLFLFSSHSFALSEVEISGEMDFQFSLTHRPTGENGRTQFNMSSLFLDLNAPLIHDNLFVASIEGSESAEGVDSRFGLRVREAFVDLVSIFEGMKALRVGLIPQPWQEAKYELWPYRFLGRDAWAMTEKWNYQSPSDLGFSYMAELPWNMGEWALTVVNGEGLNAPEEGPYKESSLFVRFAQGGPWSLSTSYTKGNFEKYDRAISNKERLQALLAYNNENWLVGLEYLNTLDPANALQDFDMAENVDVLEILGTEVRGEAASAFFAFPTGEYSDLMFRYDYLKPLKDEESRDLHTFVTAWGWTVTEGVKSALMLDYTHYADNYSSGARPRSKVSWAAQVLF